MNYHTLKTVGKAPTTTFRVWTHNRLKLFERIDPCDSCFFPVKRRWGRQEPHTPNRAMTWRTTFMSKPNPEWVPKVAYDDVRN